MTKPNHFQSASAKLLAEALPEGIILINQDWHILWYNAVAQQLLALDQDTPQRITDLIHSSQFISALSHCNDDVVEIKSPINNNTVLSIHVRPYRDQQYLLILQNMTHTRRLEKVRQDFIANVSHELRTPLTVFQGYLEILLDQLSIDKDKLADILQQMAEQSQRMKRIVEDLLLLSRLESVEPNTDTHDIVAVASLIRAIHDDAKKLSGDQHHQFHLELDDHCVIEGQPHELRNAFSNIIFNAVRYTPPHGDIRIRWYHDNQYAYFSVTDTGIGIGKKHIDYITQRFYRVDKARSREQGGTGLGLAIVKHVLLRHHGQLFIDSDIDKGSTFTCRFDLLSKD